MNVRPRYSLRLLLAIVTTTAILLGWKTNREYEREKAIAALSAAGGWVMVEDSVPDWVKQFLGQHTGEYVRAVRMMSPGASSSVLRGMGSNIGLTFAPPEPMLDIEAYFLTASYPIDDAPMRKQFADADLASLAACEDCHMLDLSHTTISDAALAHLHGLRRLEWLLIRDTAVTDGGLAQLHHLKTLRYVYLDGTRVTPAEIDALEKAIPGIEVVQGQVEVEMDQPVYPPDPNFTFIERDTP